MKYLKQLSLALLCCSPKLYGNDVYSHTYFSVLPQYQTITNLTQSLLVDQAHDDGRVLNKNTIQLTVFGGQSVNGDSLRNFFLFDGKPNLLVRENPQMQGEETIDTVDYYLGIPQQDLIFSDFNVQTVNGAQTSTITVDPKQTVYGAAVTVRIPLSERWWGIVDIPVIHVRNNLDFTETYTYNPAQAQSNAVGFYDYESGTTSIPVATMCQAFRQVGMKYGRIQGIQKVTRIADLTLKIGYDIIDRTDEYMALYGGLVFPTGNKPKGEYVFEAVAGNGGHCAIQAGLYGQVRLQENPKASVWLGWTFESNYLFSNTQVRSFDLINRPWSRYMQVFANDTARQTEVMQGQAPYRETWGINYFTQEVNVKPGYLGNFNLLASCQGIHWQGTLGMNTTVRQAEKVKLAQPWQQGPEIAMLPLYGANNQPGSTQPLRTMSALPNSNDYFNSTSYVTEAQLDLNSAAHPAARSHTLYGMLAYYRQEVTHPQNYEIGTSYEFATQNVVLNRWMLWGKVQIAF